MPSARRARYATRRPSGEIAGAAASLPNVWTIDTRSGRASGCRGRGQAAEPAMAIAATATPANVHDKRPPARRRCLGGCRRHGLARSPSKRSASGRLFDLQPRVADVAQPARRVNSFSAHRVSSRLIQVV